MDLSASAILKKLQSFRETKWFNAVLLVVLGFVAVGLYSLSTAGSVGVCLGIILTPVSIFVIPYWLGERSMKRFVLNFIPVFIIAVLVISALQTQAVLSQGPPALSSGVPSNTPNANLPALTLWNGTVVPYKAPAANQTYEFHVRLKQAGGVNVSRTTVTLNLTQIVGLSESPHAYTMAVDNRPLYANRTNGTWYVLWQPLTEGVYGFYFFANDQRGNTTFSAVVLGPLIAPVAGWYGIWLISTLEYMVYPGSFYFVILFMWWYTRRTRRLRERLVESRRGEKADVEKDSVAGKKANESGDADKTPSPSQEKSRKVAAFTCTNCGADVTEADAKCPKCGAVFED